MKDSIFATAQSTSAYLKCGILGFQGSGKTYTAVEIALGLHKLTSSNKGVAFLDTETGSDWAIPRFETAGIPLLVSKSRAFRDLCNGLDELADNQNADIVIVDSVTHFWAELMEAYQRDHKISGRIPFHHWMPIKAEWKKFSDRFVNSKLHLIACGRAGWEYDYEEDEEGHKDLIKTGTRMKAETEFGFEASLLLEMERVRETGKVDGKRVGKVGAKVIHRCHVLKDRRMDKDTLDGRWFDNPSFDCFLPHIQALSLGGVHLGVDTTRTSEGTFTVEGESYASVNRRRQVALEEIEGELAAKYGGAGQTEKRTRAALKKHLFGTYSDTALAQLEPEQLQSGLMALRQILAADGMAEKILAEVMANGREK